MLINNISSNENKVFKDALKLLSLKKYRDNLGEFLVENTKFCYEIFKHKVKIEKVFYTEKCYLKNKDLINELIKVAVKAYIIPENLIKKLSKIEEPQGIVCVCKKLKNNIKSLEQLCRYSEKILILEDIQNPLNLGTILRTADALKINSVILSKGCCDIYNDKVLRGSMGSILRLNFCFQENLEKTVTQLKEDFHIPVFATYLDSSSKYVNTMKFPKKCAVIIGNEGKGLSKAVVKACSLKIKIPINDKTDSLNASVAAGIIMWELVRERR